MGILTQIKIWYYQVLLWADDLGSSAKSSPGFMRPSEPIQREHHNQKLARGVRHMLKWMRSLTPEQRQELIDKDENLLMKAGYSRRKGWLERLDMLKAQDKLNKGPKSESEQSMADTFVRNQHKYRLQARIRALHREMRKGDRPAADIAKELAETRKELKKWE